MVSQPLEDPPDPTEIAKILSSRISLSSLKLLPSTLQMFAHLQLLSDRIRREATRALALHADLINHLEDDGIDEALWIEQGALKTSEGKALRRIKEEGQGEEEIPREDVMMELSFQLRLMHLSLLLATKGTKPEGKLRELLDTYFPPNLILPIQTSPREAHAEEVWRQGARQHRMCYIRAMTPHQARIMSLHRQAAEAMFEMLHRSIVENKARPTWYDLMPEKTRKANEEMEIIREDVMGILEGILRDKKIIDDIFAPPEVHERDATSQQDMERLAEYDVDQDMKQDYVDHHSNDRNQVSGDTPSGYRSVISRSSSKRKLVDQDSTSGSSSPPPLRLVTTPSQADNKPSSPIILRTVSSDENGQSERNCSSPRRTKKPRRSGLPPPEGPNYTAQLSAS